MNLTTYVKYICRICFPIFVILSTQVFAQNKTHDKLNELFSWFQWTEDGLEQVEISEEQSLKKTGSGPESELTSEDFDRLKIQRKTLDFDSIKSKGIKSKELLKIVFIGDTGCRLKESKIKNSYQNCQNPKAWPFPVIAQSVASEKADLIIHLGDYHYRESCAKKKECSKWSAFVGYGWEPWKLDFFEPAKITLASAPWIFVRGNHEDCQRAYTGYMKFFKKKSTHSCPEFEEPELLNFGDLAIINIDSSSISDIPGAGINEFTTQKLKQFSEKIEKYNFKNIWIITHKPVIGLVPLGPIYAPINVNLKKILESQSWYKKVNLMLAGHVHNSQMTRASQSPLQIVLGNSGTSLESSKKNITDENIKMLDLEQARIMTSDFGYAVLSRKSNEFDWRVEYKNLNGKVLFECSLANLGQKCFSKK